MRAACWSVKFNTKRYSYRKMKFDPCNFKWRRLDRMIILLMSRLTSTEFSWSWCWRSSMKLEYSRVERLSLHKINASAHLTKKVKRILREENVWMHYLPSYSLELVPVELIFGILKKNEWRKFTERCSATLVKEAEKMKLFRPCQKYRIASLRKSGWRR